MDQYNFTVWDAWAVIGGSGGCHYEGIEYDYSLNPETINTTSFITTTKLCQKRNQANTYSFMLVV